MIGAPIPILIAAFALASAVVVAAGIVLAKSGDQIAERTGLGGLVVGMLLLAGATSLPEVATDISASLAGAPDLAVGDLFGSSMANMAILAVIDLLHRGRVWPNVGIGHARLATVAISLTAIAVLGIVVPPRIAIGWVGVETVVIVAGYIAAVLWIRRSPMRAWRRAEDYEAIIRPTGWGETEHARPVRMEVARFAAASLMVLVAARSLPSPDRRSRPRAASVRRSWAHSLSRRRRRCRSWSHRSRRSASAPMTLRSATCSARTPQHGRAGRCRCRVPSGTDPGCRPSEPGGGWRGGHPDDGACSRRGRAW